MNSLIVDYVLEQTGAGSARRAEVIQSLWSGYGEIVRFDLEGASHSSVVVKHIAPPDQSNHPRGWDTDFSHVRKLESYLVESNWYQYWSSKCDDLCRVPNCLGIKTIGAESIIILEDLDKAGYALRLETLGEDNILACLRWLANFHGCYMNDKAESLWEIGTYWNLSTRPDEWAAMEEGSLKQAASLLDDQLNNARFKTIVHGDAKSANFCFSDFGNSVAAVDFQYAGGGCGMKDVAYFLGSCMDEDACERNEQHYLDYYFKELKLALNRYQKRLDVSGIELEWRELFPVAWTDFYRFLQGWMPTHQKINRYTRKLADQVLT
jgi:hypothetical protein